jgi:hypothetical protein
LIISLHALEHTFAVFVIVEPLRNSLSTPGSPTPERSCSQNVGKWEREANMAAKREPSKKVIDKHAKFLAAWEAAGFPDKFEYEGTALNNVRSTADWYRERKLRAAKG